MPNLMIVNNGFPPPDGGAAVEPADGEGADIDVLGGVGWVDALGEDFGISGAVGAGAW